MGVGKGCVGLGVTGGVTAGEGVSVGAAVGSTIVGSGEMSATSVVRSWLIA